MTGFSRVEGHDASCSWAWEARSVNGKGLDSRVRVPSGLEILDQPARERVAKRFRRGNVSVQLNVTWAQVGGGYRVNQPLLDHLVDLLPGLRERLPDAPPVRIEGLLGLRGVIEPTDETQTDQGRETLEADLLRGLERALDALADMRRAEGARLLEVVNAHVDIIAGLRDRATVLAATQPETLAARLREQVETLSTALPALPEDRIAQEVALLVSKADVREELDRLTAHIEASRELLTSDGAVGRKLDFLCQEFNREANTLCSKSSDVELTRIGLDLKAAIEQLREQVQNIE